ncbi:putative protease S8 tripeptidyl peptidase I [Xylogone sp. PMI_703]|nr:putative protease S8 tripeptidyl peptidase I [Xylogone sp. PMI_703]
MHFLGFATIALGIGFSIAGPAPRNHVRHEKRDASSQWVRRSRVDPDVKLPVRIALSQSNIHFAHDLLMEISDPRSEKYGQHMSAKEVGKLFQPSRESVDKVREWLHDSGIDTKRHKVSTGRGWLKFDASVEELESLLATEYHIFRHSHTEEDHIGCNEYHLPQHIQEHVEFITPAVSFEKIQNNHELKRKRDQQTRYSSGALHPIVKPATQMRTFAAGTEIPCYVAVTPECIRQLYQIPKGTTAQPGNEIGVFENGDYYDQADLDLTFQVIAPYIPNGTHPILHGINGGVAPFDGEVGIESLLDLSLILPLVYPQKAILFQVDDQRAALTSQGFGNTFLDALDASYCTFEGGDDPTLDPHYPDLPPYPPGEPNWVNGTWNHTEMCGAYKPTNVISVSYGLGESTFSYFYENRQCQEYMKLGLQGVSVIYSSGDSGVSNRGQCLYPKNATSFPALGAFSPSFPAACPYVTTVGATQLNNTAELVETAVFDASTAYFSGGGFSNYWPAPDYQADTLKSYFKNTPPPYNLTAYGTPVYNASGRGYPDVAAVGLNILLYDNLEPDFVGGTSASAPIFASIINLINEQRLAAGKGPVGFLNPTLYQNPNSFNDITTGNNPGCGTSGFSAVKGWDPVTGLGTPNFPKLLDVFMALP